MTFPSDTTLFVTKHCSDLGETQDRIACSCLGTKHDDSR